MGGISLGPLKMLESYKPTSTYSTDLKSGLVVDAEIGMVGERSRTFLYYTRLRNL